MPPSTPVPPGTRVAAINADQPFDEACRLIMLLELGRLGDAHRGAVASGGRVRKHTVHVMRVAVRRLRTIIAVAIPSVPKTVAGQLARFDLRLRQLNRRLAAVRDLDVLIADLDATPMGHGKATKDPAAKAVRSQRKRARRRLASDLDGFAANVKRFARLVRDPRALAPTDDPAPRVCDLLPAVLWFRYGAARRFEAQTRPGTEALHALRREVRQLRFVIEFFSGVLDVGAGPVLAHLSSLQHRLGSLNDANTAAEVLAEAVGKHLARSPRIIAYRGRRRAQVAKSLEAVAQDARWLFDPTFRTRLERMLRPL